MLIQQKAVLKQAKLKDIKFIYAVHHYQGLLDYNSSFYFKTEEEAREVYKQTLAKIEQEIQDNNFEIHNHTDTSIYFEGSECSEKLKLEAIILP